MKSTLNHRSLPLFYLFICLAYKVLGLGAVEELKSYISVIFYSCNSLNAFFFQLASYGSVLQSDGQDHQREKDLFQNPLHATRCVGPQNG